MTVITGSPAMRYAAMTSFPATAIGRCSGDTIALVFGVGQRRSSSRDAGAGHAVAVISDATGQLLTGLSITAGGTSGVS